jgi:protein-disulfide isomerase
MSGGPAPTGPAGPASGNRRTQLIVLGVLAALILIAAIVISQSGDDDSSGGSSDGDTAAVESALEGIPQEGVFLGDDGAPVVTEFVDLQCPFCGEFATNAFNDVVDQHVKTGDVQWELRVISFLGEDSGEAAEMAAAAALQNKLYEFAETFYLNQGEENSGYVTDEFLTEIAEQTPGLDVEQALADRSSPEAQDLIAQNEARATELKVNSTPTFLLTDGAAPTALPLNDLTPEAFSEALAAAQGG